VPTGKAQAAANVAFLAAGGSAIGLWIEVVIAEFVDDLKQAVLGGTVAKAVSIFRFSSDAEWPSSSIIRPGAYDQAHLAPQA
jgi:hypothetical protein